MRVESASRAALQLGGGLAALEALVRPASTNPTPLETRPNTPATSAPIPEIDVSAAQRHLEELDQMAVEQELKRYEDAGIIEDVNEVDNFDIMVYWQVSTSDMRLITYRNPTHVLQTFQDSFPLLFKTALDILPAQASSVPCERVFSSGKETDSLRRSKLSPIMMEILQVLKFHFRSKRLDFSDGLMATERELMVIDVDPKKVQELLEKGDVDAILQLIESSE
jgi:DNA-binding transcriptional ArsR family regulator